MRSSDPDAVDAKIQTNKLTQELTKKLEDNALVNKIVDDFAKALEDNPGMSYDEILERLGISNKEFNITKITDDLRKGRQKEGDVNPAIIKRVLGLDTKKPIPNKKIHLLPKTRHHQEQHTSILFSSIGTADHENDLPLAVF